MLPCAPYFQVCLNANCDCRSCLSGREQHFPQISFTPLMAPIWWWLLLLVKRQAWILQVCSEFFPVWFLVHACVHIFVYLRKFKFNANVVIGVHDSYWTHACDVDEMNRILREKFVELYDAPILENVMYLCLWILYLNLYWREMLAGVIFRGFPCEMCGLSACQILVKPKNKRNE